MEALPNEILVEIMAYLSVRERYRLGKLSRRLYNVFLSSSTQRSASFELDDLLTTPRLNRYLSRYRDTLEDLSVRNCHWISFAKCNRKWWRHLKSLDVTGSHVTTKQFCELVSGLEDIRHLAFQLFLLSPLTSLAKLLSDRDSILRTLESLSVVVSRPLRPLMHSLAVNPADFIETMTSCSNLRRFEVMALPWNSFEFDYTGLERLYGGCTSLCIHWGCYCVEVDETADHKSLMDLLTSFFSKYSLPKQPPPFAAIFSFPRLTTLRLAGCHLRDEKCVELARHLENVTALDLSCNSLLTGSSFHALLGSDKARGGRLKKLWLAKNRRMFGEAGQLCLNRLVMLSEFAPQLQLLDISGINASALEEKTAAMNVLELDQHQCLCHALAKLSRLKVLLVSPSLLLLPKRRSDTRMMTEAVRSVVSACSAVTHLHFDSMCSTLKIRHGSGLLWSLGEFARWTNLQRLVIQGCPGLKALTGLRAVTENCTGLRELAISNTGISGPSEREFEAALSEALTYCANLEKFGLCQKMVLSSLIFGALRSCTNLRYCRLDLRKQRVSDCVDIPHFVRNMPKLLAFHLFCMMDPYRRSQITREIDGRARKSLVSLHFHSCSEPYMWRGRRHVAKRWTAGSNLEMWWEDIRWYKSQD